MLDINNLTIDPEFRNVSPSLTNEEYGLLEDHIIEIGHLIEPIVVWQGHNIIVDGHNRYQICKKWAIEVKIQEVEFKDKAEAKTYIIKHHMGRRNLSLFQRIEIARKMEEVLAEHARANHSASEEKYSRKLSKSPDNE